VIFANTEYTLAALQKPISTELRLLQYMKVSLDRVTVIIRADADAQSGQVLDVIELSQKLELTNFILRAKQNAADAH
jgi:biopolymer transport protein ExbD